LSLYGIINGPPILYGITIFTENIDKINPTINKGIDIDNVWFVNIPTNNDVNPNNIENKHTNYKIYLTQDPRH